MHPENRVSINLFKKKLQKKITGNAETCFHNVKPLAEDQVRLLHPDLQGLYHCRGGGTMQAERPA